jgi:hypothetical protein
MSDLLIRDVDPVLRQRIRESARRNQQSLSDELKDLVRRGLDNAPPDRQYIPPGQLGTYLFSLLEDEYRGDDLVFEIKDYPKPPRFE